MLFFYIRHGDPVYEPDSLTPLGERQAAALSKRLARCGIDEIYSSASNRAYMTALPTAQLLGKEITKLEWAREDYAWAQLAVKPGGWAFQSEKYRRLFASREIRSLGKDWTRHPSFAGTKFEEGIDRIQKESDRFFEQLGYRHNAEDGCYNCDMENDNRKIAFFAHQGFGLAFLSCILDIPYPEFCTHFDLCHSSMTVIDFGVSDKIAVPKVLELSNDSHIYAEGLPTEYNHIYRF